MRKRCLTGLLSLMLLLLPLSALGVSYHLDPSSGLYVDESGKIIAELWDEEGGLYIHEGVAVPIQSSDDPVQGEDGMIVGSEDYVPPVETEPEPESPHLTQAEWEARMAKAIRTNGPISKTYLMDEQNQLVEVEIEYLGLGRSAVVRNGKTELVPTSSLRWESQAPEDKRLAVVSTTKQTYATMRAKKSQKAFVMDHCEKCSVLKVASTGKTWTMVEYNGMRGYVLTSTLTFYDNNPKEFTTGLISFRGKLNSNNTVHVRTTNKSSARQLAEFACGTPLTIFSLDDKWCEVDVGGWHCYIMSEFVTLEGPPPVTASQD